MAEHTQDASASEANKSKVIHSLQRGVGRLDKFVAQVGDLPIGSPADDEASATSVQVNRSRGVSSDLVQEIEFGLETIQHLVFLVTSECGTSGQHLHLALGALARNLAAVAALAIESAPSDQGVDPDFVEDIDAGLKAISHLSTLAEDECGTEGRYLHFAIGKLADRMAEQSREAVEADYLIGSGEGNKRG